MASEPEVSTVTVRIFSDRISAEVAASNLEAHGIPSWINADDCGGMLPSLTARVRLIVRAADAEAAAALLEN